MNRLNSNYCWSLGLVLFLAIIARPLAAQQGNPSAVENADASSWQIAERDTSQTADLPDDVTTELDTSVKPDVSVKSVSAVPEQAARSSVISDAQLRRDLDEAYAALNKALEEEDSFSPVLGEHYLAYGNMLLKAGQPREARKAFVSALHLQKVNFGIYDLQQRFILKSLFDTYYVLDEPEKYEDTLRRILWLEDKSEGYEDDLTYDMILKVGNANIDLFLRKPSASELALGYLSKAKRYLQYAVRKFGDAPLTEKKLPFGELALVSLLQGITVPRVERATDDRYAAFNSARRQNRKIAISEHRKATQYHAQNLHLGGDKELREYFLKAQAENNHPEMVNALLSLGDMAQLFQRTALATRYYQSAWEAAQNLAVDDPIRIQLEVPVQLPAFNYAMKRAHVERRLPTKLIPMSFDVQESGKSTNVLPMAKDSEHIQYYKGARRALRKLTFRPAIIDGEVVRASLIEHGVRVMYDPSEEKQKEEKKAKQQAGSVGGATKK